MALVKQLESGFPTEVESKSSQPKKEIKQVDFEDQETYHFIPLNNHSSEVENESLKSSNMQSEEWDNHSNEVENESLKITHIKSEKWDELHDTEEIDRIRQNNSHLDIPQSL